MRQIGRPTLRSENPRAPAPGSSSGGVPTVIRICVLTPTLPYTGVPHAGGRYLVELESALHDGAELSFLAPDTPAARHSRDQPGAPERSWLLGLPPGATRPAKLRNFVVTNLDRAVRSVAQGAPSLAFQQQLRQNANAWALLQGADVIDLQWSEMIGLARTVRSINRRARIIGTFHDVDSQRLTREADAAEGVTRLRLRLGARLARAREAQAVDALDEAFVFSEKDRVLLPRARASVIFPPLADESSTPRPLPETPPTVVFVSYLARAENQDAARWLAQEIWPRVRAQIPTASCLLVGGGAPESLREELSNTAGLEFTGFVAELSTIYPQAWAAIVPLRFGAGVKFKVLDALAAGVPVITTPVGLEGIAAEGYVAGLSDDPITLSDRTVWALRNPAATQELAEAGHRWVVSTYGRSAYRARVRAVAGIE